MAGLLGSALAGAVKGYASNRVNEIDAQNKYDLRQKLLEAEYQKNLMLKKAGIQMQEDADQRQRDKRADYFSDVQETTTTPESTMAGYTDDQGNQVTTKAGGETITKTRQAGFGDAAERAFRAGDFEAGEGLLKVAGKKEKTFDSIKLDDGSIFSFDKSTGTGSIILKGGDKVNVPKNEIELAYQMADGDPNKAAEILVNQKSKIAAAGRAPSKPSDDDEAYADWRKKSENKGKGRDDFAREKAGWGKSDKPNSDMAQVRDDIRSNYNLEYPLNINGKRPNAPKFDDYEKEWLSKFNIPYSEYYRSNRIDENKVDKNATSSSNALKNNDPLGLRR